MTRPKPHCGCHCECNRLFTEGCLSRMWQLLPSPKTGTAFRIVGASEASESKHCAISVTRVGFDQYTPGLQILRMTCSKNPPTAATVSTAPCAIIVGASDLRQTTTAPNNNEMKKSISISAQPSYPCAAPQISA